jgi:exodeoxyribonuclease VII small subunit
MNSSNEPEAPVPLDQLTYEQAFSELEAIVASLEANDRPLEEALALYERGQVLTRYCAEMLDKADLRVQVLSSEGLADFLPPE